jgi:hypothetical protein
MVVVFVSNFRCDLNGFLDSKFVLAATGVAAEPATRLLQVVTAESLTMLGRMVRA